MGSTAGSGTWSLTPSQVSSSSLFKQGSDSRLLGSSSAQQYMPHTFEPINASLSKQQQQQHGLFGSDISSPSTLKQDQHPVHLFFNEWPTTKESWSNLDNDGSNQNAFSSTQLSISTPRASSDFASGSAYSTNGESILLARHSYSLLNFGFFVDGVQMVEGGWVNPATLLLACVVVFQEL